MKKNFLEYVVNPEDHYVFLRDVLSAKMQLSRSILTRLKAQNRIRVNGEVTWADYRLQAGDQVEVDIGFEEKSLIIPQAIPLDIIYEDDDILVINKPAGLAVHPTTGQEENTLANAVTYYWLQQGKLSLFRPINRLDKDTSGLILIGQSQYAHQTMFKQQKQRLVHRHYIAVVEGIMPEDSGCIDLPVARMNPYGCKWTVDPDGKPAVTHYAVMKRSEDFTLLSLTLGTGRTHQIRVHLSQHGYPIVGDSFYGHPSPLIGRQALHAGQLSFLQPRTGKQLNFQVDVPSDMVALVGHLQA